MCESTLKERDNVESKIVITSKHEEPNFIFQPTN